ncbi:mitochondrial import receptor subunit tom20 [Knufia obscura]|uniref:Mitochondrial import receptor subunit TOM20 n=2 Tax=Knufia TaxID=430999 RepID=A0AAN8I5F0_9EURO|nr:mitochondrial import receptor subunit tom20 [Knufia obscura]KAK5955397.1 mitochondrial import receptor subunit tom20 [Knufia fluminis]
MKTSTIVSITVGTMVTGVLAYAVYFDYQRRTNPEFRKALKRDAKRQQRKAKEESEMQGKQQREEIKNAVQEAQEEGFPTDLEEKEAFFLQQISQGEAMANDGSDPIGAALCFYKGLKVYPEPRSLIGIYDNTVPKNVLEILAQMVSQDKNLNVGSFGESKDSGSESGHGVE